MSNLPTDKAERKTYPVATGVLDYFPLAIAEIARVSWKGNEQHNPGEPLHWAREKSADQPDAMMRHFMERGKIDVDGERHSAKAAWRMLAILQLELEEAAEAEAERPQDSTYSWVPGSSNLGRFVGYDTRTDDYVFEGGRVSKAQVLANAPQSVVK